MAAPSAAATTSNPAAQPSQLQDLRRFSSLLVCPESRGELRLLEHEARVIGWHSPHAKLVYPVVDDVPVFLPRRARSFTLELEPVRNMRRLLAGSDAALDEAMSNTLEAIEGNRDIKTWEWADEEHWSRVYSERLAKGQKLEWSLRLRERQFLKDTVLNRRRLSGLVIHELACGEGQNFRELFSSHIDDQSVYIATDISLAALKLNRSISKYPNALYLLAVADNLPLATESVDLFLCIGILHHTEQKAASLRALRGVIKRGGTIVISEAVDRTHVRRHLPRALRREKPTSAHEERILPQTLWDEVTPARGFRIIAARKTWGPFYGGMVKSFRAMMRRYDWFYNAVHGFDRALIASLGWLIPVFRPGQIEIVAERES